MASGIDTYAGEAEGYKTNPEGTPYERGESPNKPAMTTGNMDRMARGAAAKKFAEQYVRECEKDGDKLYKR